MLNHEPHNPTKCLLLKKEVSQLDLEMRKTYDNDLDVVITACQYLKAVEEYQKWWIGVGGKIETKKC